MLGIEAGGTRQRARPERGDARLRHARRAAGRYSLLLQDEHGQIQETHSVSAGLDYPGVGPEHALLRATGRVELRGGRRRRIARGARRVLPRRRHPARDRVGARARRRAALGADTSGRANPDRPLGPRRQGHADAAAHAAGGRLMSAADVPHDRSVRRYARRGDGGAGARRVHDRRIPGARAIPRAVSRAVADAADVVEIGVPFTDPMADGVTIQRSSRAALRARRHAAWLLDELAAMRPRPRAPLLLMSYLNPLLAYRTRALAGSAPPRPASAASSFPTCRTRKAPNCARRSSAHGLALVQMVTPVTPPARLADALRRERRDSSTR